MKEESLQNIQMTKILEIDPQTILIKNEINKQSSQFKNLEYASVLLNQNEIVAFPTETVYGLGANCQSTDAVAKIYKAKNRPADNPLIVHVSSKNQIEQTLKTKIPEVYLPLIKKFWPGPLTILLPLPFDTPISPLCTKSQHTFGCRMPNHPVARALIELSGLPLAAPSANASTKPSCTEAKHVYEDLKNKIPLIIDGGPADFGVESTVVDGLCDPPKILRPGGVSIEEIKLYGGEFWSHVVSEASQHIPDNVTVRAPGMKYKHYSPTARVILLNPDVSIAKVKELCENTNTVALLRHNRLNYEVMKEALKPVELLDLSLGETKREMSHNLFAKFREADNLNVDLILVEAVDTNDEGLAIMNRLNKAAEVYIE